ncbi:hypothetical protein NP493_319g03011 [Ridgeia piscesae]|uniref:Uncharacterized protein n=1 Tax=Ridgeia piscesae TaxID=27915 RepID=A0AAD9NUW0_RIDPI|nr:hypothetical protein NP493_319g03011 [Ridgeia piscesae]
MSCDASCDRNMRNAKGETKQLEVESRKMDERLQELKMAMTREKEERERHSQGFWGKVIPVRNHAPGTLGFIAQQGGKENRVKIKGSGCGQCEHRAAQVSSARRTPRPNSGSSSGPVPAEKSETVTAVAVAPATRHLESPAKLADINVTFSNPPEPTNNSKLPLATNNGASLLDGNYDEEDSAASFQQALNAWRGNPSSETKTPQMSQPQTQPKVPQEMEGVVSPRQRDHINVMFHGELSYAEKLLLKQHRRGLLQSLPPALSTTHTQLRQSPGHSVDVTPSHSNISLDSDDSRTTKKPNIIKLLIDGPKDEDEEEEEKGVEFASLYHARLQSHKLLKTISNSGVTVTEMTVGGWVVDGWMVGWEPVTDLAMFFTVGMQAQPEPFQERVLTPSGQRKHQVATPTEQKVDEKWKMSNRVYQMAPRSWRPDSSLAVTVPEDNAANHISEVGVKHFEQFVAAPPGGADGKEVETISWTLSSNQIITTSNLERPLTEGIDSSLVYSQRPQTGGSTTPPSSGHFQSPRQGVNTPSGRRSQMIDGAASRLSMLSMATYDEEEELSIHEDFGDTSGLSTPDINIEDSLQQEDLADDFEDTTEQTVRDEVHALPT